MKVFVSTHPFGSSNEAPIRLLKEHGIDFKLNPYGRKIKQEELLEQLADVDGLIAGTETIDEKVLEKAPKLKIISRVGIGLDSIHFDAVLRRNILLTYTPEAVTMAVAELTVANMLNLCRSIITINNDLKSGKWNRFIGYELSTLTVGIIGFGRVGKQVTRLLGGFGCRILVNDIAPDDEAGSHFNVRFCEKDEIYRHADILTLHVPKTPLTENMVGLRELKSMKPTAFIINTSRGGIINEADLHDALAQKVIAGAAVDVYTTEPYQGPLAGLENIILTAHSGSCSTRARYLMEYTAASEIVKYMQGHPPIFPVPDELVYFERNKKHIPINSDWHDVANFTSIARSDEAYQLYRRRWRQYPTNAFVGPTPLNVDVELVYSRAKCASVTDLTLSAALPGSSFMSEDTFATVIREIRGFNEPVAMKFGLRGDPLYHPKALRFIKLAVEAGCVETIVSTRGQLLDKQMIMGLVDAGLDILNIFLDADGMHPEDPGANPDKIHALCDQLNVIREVRALGNSAKPRIRLVIRQHPFKPLDVSRYQNYWKIWADNLTLCDTEVALESDEARHWSCSKLWQRLTVTHDGSLLMCHYDLQEKRKLGQLGQSSMQEAWACETMQSMRKAHLENKANTLDPCNNCAYRKTEYAKIKAGL